MTKKYTPATFQPTIRPSWAGILSYIDANEKAEILEAIICFPNERLGGVKSRFYNETIKPDLYEQYDKFLKICDIRCRSAKTYWGEHKLSKSYTNDKQKYNLLKDKDKDKIKDKDKMERVVKGKPTLQEVMDYCQERNNGVDANKWFDYYTANGWKVGRNPMKDWKATVRTWERNESKPIQKEQTVYVEEGKFFIDPDAPEYKDLFESVTDKQELANNVWDWIYKNFAYQEVKISFVRSMIEKFKKGGV